MIKSALAMTFALFAASSLQAMTVSEFLKKADALEKKGAMAMFSGDLRLLMNEGKTAGKALRAERLADIKAGRKPNACPPKNGSIGSDEVLAHFRAIPPQQRGVSVKTALAGLMRKKYPCPA